MHIEGKEAYIRNLETEKLLYMWQSSMLYGGDPGTLD